MAIAPRTRIRRLMRLLKIQTDWTRRYDAHVARAVELAREYAHRNGGSGVTETRTETNLEAVSDSGTAKREHRGLAARIRFSSGSTEPRSSVVEDPWREKSEPSEAA